MELGYLKDEELRNIEDSKLREDMEPQVEVRDLSKDTEEIFEHMKGKFNAEESSRLLEGVRALFVRHYERLIKESYDIADGHARSLEYLRGK